MKTAFLTCWLICFSVGAAEAEEVVFNALPTSKVSSEAQETSRELLNESKRHEFRLLITKNGNEYLWVSRENRPLVHSISGAFHMFADPRGSGYIKIFDSSFIPESVRSPGPRYTYMEHLHMHLGTITYWGSAESFSP